MTYNRKVILGLLVALSIFGSASAAVCVADSIRFHLTAAESGTETTALAKCFSSFTLTLSTGCTLTMTSTVENVNKIYYKSYISKDALLDEYANCPTISTKTDGANTVAAVTDLLDKAVYANGGTVTGATATAADAALVVTMTGGAKLTFRPWSRDGSGANGVFSDLATNMAACGTNDPGTQCAGATGGCTVAGTYSYQVATSKFLCALCPAGTWSPAGASTCTSAAAGTYITAVGSAAVSAASPEVACPTGSEAPTTGNSDCARCQIGWFSTGGTSGCKQCPEGWYSHVVGAATCVACVNGRPKVCASTTPCDLGGTASSGSMAVEVSAQLGDASGWTGYGYPAVFGTCVGSGTNSVGVRLSFAVSGACTVDIQVLGVSANSCSKPENLATMLTAYYVDAENMFAFADGASTTTLNKRTVIKIAKGGDNSHAALTAAQAQTAPATLYSVTGAFVLKGGLLVGATPLDGATIVNTCPPGTYIESGSLAATDLSCAPCRAGEYCEAGATDATTVSCVAGKVNPIVGAVDSTACGNCATGYYAPNPGTATCSQCVGTVTDSGTACQGDCGTGTNKVWDTDTQNCVCQAGFGYVGGSCTPCSDTTYSAGGLQACSPCATPLIRVNATTCLAASCAVGEYKDPADSLCKKCLAGNEPNTDKNGCTACATGKYNPGDGGFAAFPKCAPIPAGMQADAAKAVVTDCDAGTYSYYTSGGTRVPSGSGGCEPCPDNTFNPIKGQKRCVSCPGGSYSVTGTPAGALSCIKCPVGQYKVAFSAGTCQNCPPGTDTAGKTGAASCRSCSPGEKAPSAGTAVCELCASNTYSGTRATTCSSCPAGSDTKGESGAGECTKCSPGYSGTAGNDCAVCNAGYYQDKSGQSACKQCGVGRFNDEKGSDSCAPCDPGQYNPKKAATSCRSCPAGSFSKSGAASCTLCDAGQYAEAGSAKCTACRTGSWSAKGAEACSVCPAGYSCTATAQTACLAGTYQDAVGQTKCKPCPSKTYAAGTGNKKCLPCANPASDKTSCNSRRLLMVDRFDHTSA